jgi:hypothetical protein
MTVELHDEKLWRFITHMMLDIQARMKEVVLQLRFVIDECEDWSTGFSLSSSTAFGVLRFRD